VKRVLIDTNIILDIALKRSPYFDASSKIFYFIDQRIIAGYVTASTITDIYYISKKETNNQLAVEFISNLLDIVDILGVDKDIIIMALQSDIKDFEDAVQASAAAFNEIQIIITRNKQDFKNSDLDIYTPAEFIELQQK